MELNACREVEIAEMTVFDQGLHFPSVGGGDIHFSDQVAIRVNGQNEILRAFSFLFLGVSFSLTAFLPS